MLVDTELSPLQYKGDYCNTLPQVANVCPLQPLSSTTGSPYACGPQCLRAFHYIKIPNCCNYVGVGILAQ